MSPVQRLLSQIVTGFIVYHVVFFLNLGFLSFGLKLSRAVWVLYRPLWAH